MSRLQKCLSASGKYQNPHLVHPRKLLHHQAKQSCSLLLYLPVAWWVFLLWLDHDSTSIGEVGSVSVPDHTLGKQIALHMQPKFELPKARTWSMLYWFWNPLHCGWEVGVASAQTGTTHFLCTEIPQMPEPKPWILISNHSLFQSREHWLDPWEHRNFCHICVNTLSLAVCAPQWAVNPLFGYLDQDWNPVQTLATEKLDI